MAKGLKFTGKVRGDLALRRNLRANVLRFERGRNKVGGPSRGLGSVASRNMKVRKIVAYSWSSPQRFRGGSTFSSFSGDFEAKHPRGYRGRFRNK